MRFVFCLALLVVSIIAGHKFADKYTLRRKFYSDFSFFNKHLKSEISFSQTTLLKMTDLFDKKTDFYISLKKYIENKEFNFEKKYLSLEEKGFFKGYIENVGAHDKITQLNYLESVEQKIDEYYSSAEKEEKKYKTLYIKLGLLFGLMLFIIFI